MCDIFTKKDIVDVFGKNSERNKANGMGKTFMFMGDSIMRNLYKDFVWLTSDNTNGNLIPQRHMQAKGEETFMGDNVITKSNENLRGRDYEEERDWYSGEHNDIQYTFMFITKCYSDKLEKSIRNWKDKYGSYPDFILINSCLWDINRWGPKGIDDFKENVPKLMKLFKGLLPDYTQLMWMTTPPISVDVRGGFMIEQLEFTKHSMRFNVMESNVYAANVVASYGYDVIDMHYYLLKQINRRCPDGIHWNPDAVRLQLNIVMTHIALARDIPLPGRWKVGLKADEMTNTLLDEAIAIAEAASNDVNEQLEMLDSVAGNLEERRIAVAKRSNYQQT